METTESSNTPNSSPENTEINTETESSQAQHSNGDIPKEITETAPQPEWIDLLGSGGIMKKILKEGEPDTKPQRSDKCEIHYTSTLEDDTLVEDTSETIHLGECDVIQGLDVAISLMNINEKCLLKIEPRLAYGNRGLTPKIPPNSTILYEIELKNVYPADEIETLSLVQRKEIGNKKKERGNWWYGRGENNIAIQCYRRALDYLDEVESSMNSPLKTGEPEMSDVELQNLLENRVSVYNNMAAAQIKMELYDVGLSSLEKVLRCQPNNVKALFRKAKIYIEKNDLVAAMKSLKKASEIEPDNQDIQKQINAVTQRMQKQKVTERELAKRMLGGSKAPSSENVTKTSYKKSTKFGIWTLLGATISVGLATFAAYRLKYT